jgi:hypothetical protein
MRTAEAQIQAAILHPEREVREAATHYFADAYSTEASVMPLVIQAVEKYGREGASPLLRLADRLVQTPATVAWLMEELRRSYDSNDIPQDNYRCAVALALCQADPHLLLPVKDEIPALPAFPPQLRQDLVLQVERSSWDWPTGWKALQQWGERTMDAGHVGRWDAEQADAMARALGRFREQGGESVLTLLHRRYRGYEKQLVEWLEPQLVTLAGEMKLDPAIPLLVDRLHEDDDAVAEEVVPALAQIGTEQVIDALAHDWPAGDGNFRYFAVEAFERIHCDRSVEAILKLLPEEKDLSMACGLGFALLRNFAEESIEVVRRLVLDGGGREYLSDMWDADDLREPLATAAAVMNRPFPESSAWDQDVLARNRALAARLPFLSRLADHLGPDPERTQGQDREDIEDRGDYEARDDFEGPEAFDAEPAPFTPTGPKIGRNDPCPCGSGKKYKKCCLGKKPMDPIR